MLVRGRARQRTLHPLDLKLERTLRRLRRVRSSSSSHNRFASLSVGEEQQESEQVFENMALPVKNLGIPGAFEATCGIQAPTTGANNFEIKPSLINLVQSHPFCGKSNESPHEHLKQFEHYCDTIKPNGVTSDYVRLTLFRFSLLG